MKTLHFYRMGWLVALLFGVSSLLAFDPVGPPPQKTLEWTMHQVAATVWPAIDIDDAPLDVVVEHLSLRDAVSLEEYRWEVDAGQLHLPKGWSFSFHGKKVATWQVFAAFAEKCDADLLIKPGVIVLVPRKKG